MATTAALLDPEQRMPKPKGCVQVLREFGQIQSDAGVLYLMERKGNYKECPVFQPEQSNIRGNRGSKLRGCGVQGAVAAAVIHFAETRKAVISSSLEWQNVMANQHSTAPRQPPRTMLSRMAARPVTSRWAPSPMHMVDEDEDDHYTRPGSNDENVYDSDTDSEYWDNNMEQALSQKPSEKQPENNVLEIMLLDDASDEEEDGVPRFSHRQHRSVATTATNPVPNVAPAQQPAIASQTTSITQEGTEAAKPKKKFRKLRKACSAMRRACTAAVSSAFVPRNSKSDNKDK